MTSSGESPVHPVPDQDQERARLLVVRLGSMGDVIHTLPAVAALRAAWPEATIGWVIEERWVELLCASGTPRFGPRSPQRPLVDKLHLVDTKRWRRALTASQTWEQIAAAVRELRAPRYPLAVDFQGAARSSLIARLSRAAAIFGFAQPRENIAAMFYTRKVIARGKHIVEQNLSLAEAVAQRKLNLPPVPLPQDEAAEQAALEWLERHAVKEFVLMNPGAGWGAKQWPPERFGEVVKQLAKDGLQTVFNFGPGEEATVKAAQAASGGAAQTISSSIAQLIALTRRARLFVGGDTGPLHLAAALQVPVVAIFGPTDPARNGPFASQSIVLRSQSSVTSHARKRTAEEGLLKITVQDVTAAARKLLGAQRG
ncbi:MAG: glycosyltransferase family 9 protein [Acidobacteria bacterium]|nr:glycosyltransferase family 9 protein [Acidobacteriota bacterium]